MPSSDIELLKLGDALAPLYAKEARMEAELAAVKGPYDAAMARYHQREPVTEQDRRDFPFDTYSGLLDHKEWGSYTLKTQSEWLKYSRNNNLLEPDRLARCDARLASMNADHNAKEDATRLESDAINLDETWERISDFVEAEIHPLEASAMAFVPAAMEGVRIQAGIVKRRNPDIFENKPNGDGEELVLRFINGLLGSG